MVEPVAEVSTMSAETKVQIRRYPNRRLYDRSRRQYVTLKDIEDLVLAGKTVEVSDSRTGEDMTRQILTQILMDRHPHKMEIFPVAMLHSVLRANDFAMDLWRGYLRQSLTAMEAMQKAAAPFAMPIDWVSAFLPALAPPARPDREPVERRIDELSRRLDRLQSRGEPPPAATGHEFLDRLEQRVHDLEDHYGDGGGRSQANGR
jgi:polyhydroxyalkanoate synthesis repressor PhaR